jgi:uncharacterized protein YbaR (Trm112 family)
MVLEAKLLEILACPACHAEVRRARPEGLRCTVCGRIYPVRDGIPVMRVEEASGERSGSS